jgi:ABC-2 type transport system ATP-binding protein
MLALLPAPDAAKGAVATNEDGALAIRCAGLVKRYGALTAVDGLELQVRRGECFGLLGPNGAGKTTSIEIIEGLTSADGGEVEVLGQRWGAGDDRALRARLGVQLQETILGDKQTVEEVVTLFRSFSPRGRDVLDTIRRVDLEAKRGAQVHQLSGGQRQRLALACALVGDPELLFLDEPTTGLDPQARQSLWEHVTGFLAGGGTVLLTTHYMDEAQKLCDRVGIMDAGKIIALGTPAELIARLGVEQIVELSTAPDLPPEAFEGLPGVTSVRRTVTRTTLNVDAIQRALPALLARLEAHGAVLESLVTHQPTLDDVFVSLTGRGLRDD